MKKRLFKFVLVALVIVMFVGMFIPMTASAAWVESAQGWQFQENGGFATGWRLIDGLWYFFDNSGLMETGWLYYNGQWFFLRANGAMATGHVLINGVWHFFGTNGTWIEQGSVWYEYNWAPGS